MANRHFGRLADVWKHLALAAVLGEIKPERYAETHAGSAVYPMVDDAERRFGVMHFVRAAQHDPVLSRSTYLTLVNRFLALEKPVYPGSAALALSALGKEVDFLFCDKDAASAADLREWSRRVDVEHVEVAEADGMSTTERWLAQGDSARAVVVHVDPFDPRATGDCGKSALELAAEVVARDSTLVYWYGYDKPEDAAWAYRVLVDLAGEDLWCGDVMVVDELGGGRSGDLGLATTPGTGCGMVLGGNVIHHAAAACGELGAALARAYQGATLPSGAPGGIRFSEFGSR